MSYKKLPQEILLAGVLSVFSGATEIRTREPVVPVTRFPGVPLQPLEHRSNVWWFDVVVLGLMRFAAHLRCKGTVFFLFLRVFCEFFWWVCMFLTLF